ncbi:MAG: cytochrome c [Proteobacteria bacterium]|nr:cytochrome c [Pseudomonadota bacterium]MDA0992717.1 cytochrome c [Pseudomonadota bacterium]
MKNVLLTVVTVTLIIVLGITGFAYSGIYDVSANNGHSSVVSWFLSATRHESIARRAKDVEVPDLTDESLALAGINDFNSMCIGCHGAPGIGPEAIGQGLNPPAPDLADEAAEMSAAELFWVTKNGIMMTGMPAWGATHGDDAIWPVVAFMTKLPDLDADGYQQMLTAAAGQGHHAEEAPGAAHSHEESEASATSDIHVHDDGTEHDHGAAAKAAEEEAPAADDHSTHQHNED